MNSTEIALIKESMANIKPNAKAFGKSFYSTLLKNNPDIKKLFAASANSNAKRSFHIDMEEQSKHFMNMLEFYVNNLDDIEKIQDNIARLGQRHQTYQVTPEHYDAMAASLLASFAEHLGNNFSEETRQAWIKAYGQLTDIMLQGYDQPPPTKATISSLSPSAKYFSE